MASRGRRSGFRQSQVQAAENRVFSLTSLVVPLLPPVHSPSFSRTTFFFLPLFLPARIYAVCVRSLRISPRCYRITDRESGTVSRAAPPSPSRPSGQPRRRREAAASVFRVATSQYRRSSGKRSGASPVLNPPVAVRSEGDRRESRKRATLDRRRSCPERRPRITMWEMKKSS